MTARLSEALHDNADLAAKLSKALRDLADAEARYERAEAEILMLGESDAVTLHALADVKERATSGYLAGVAPHLTPGQLRHRADLLVRAAASGDIFDRLHIEALVREWCAGVGLEPPMPPYLVDGLVKALRMRFQRISLTKERAERLVREVEDLLECDLRPDVRERLLKRAGWVAETVPQGAASGGERLTPTDASS